MDVVSNANSAHEHNLSPFWNASKAVLRGHIISYIATYKNTLTPSFTPFYMSLYTDSQDSQAIPQGREFLCKIQLTTVSDDNLQLLNVDISDLEVRNTIKGLALEKAPGPDRFTSEFYKIILDHIDSHLTRYYNSILSSGTLRQEEKMPYIKVLPEPGNDPLCPESYLPMFCLFCISTQAA